MRIDSIELVNVLLAVFLLLIMKRGDMRCLLISIFIYGSFNFLYTIIPLLSYAPMDQLVNMHTYGSGALAKLSTIIFLLTTYLLLVIQWRKFWGNDKLVGWYLFFTMTVIFVGYLANLRSGDWLQFQNILGLEGMLLLLWLGYIGLSADKRSQNLKYPYVVLINIVLIASLCVSFYEVFSHRAWANFTDSHGQMVWRASSFLFNPNLLGVWYSMLGLGLGYLLHKQKGGSSNTLILGLVLVYAGLYFSGSRTALYLLIACQTIIAVLLRSHLLWFRCVPLIILLFTFFGIFSFSNLIGNYAEKSRDGWQSVALLGDRLLMGPINLIKYGFKSQDIEPEFTTAIDGRFSGNLRDSGILTLYDDAGWLGLVAFVSLQFMLFVWAFRTYFIRKDVQSVYAIAILFFCSAIGISLRYQVFPLWLFIAMLLTPCLFIWRKSLLISK